jgi:hypothetical protein
MAAFDIPWKILQYTQHEKADRQGRHFAIMPVVSGTS